MRKDMTRMELAARLILGDVEATKLTAHPVEIRCETGYRLSPFGKSASSFCHCCGGTAGTVKVQAKGNEPPQIEIETRADHRRVIMVFVLEPAQEPGPTEIELCKDALVTLTDYVDSARWLMNEYEG